MGGEPITKDSQDLLDLFVKRSSIKGQITKFKNYLSNAIAKETLTSIELAELTIRLSKFESLSNRFDDLQNQIEVSMSEMTSSNHITKNLRALSTLGQPTNKWDVLIIHIMSAKLDNHTLLKWEECRGAFDDVPNLEQFYKFLVNRADVLESINRNSNKSTQCTTPKTTASNSNNNRANTNSYACSSDRDEESAPSPRI
ncbi:Gag-pol polyprotein, partial [Operophtera brumata]